MRKFIRQIRDIYRPLQLHMLAVVGFIATSQALNFFPPYINSKIIDQLVATSTPPEQVAVLALIGLGVMLFRSILLRWFREQYELKYVDFAVPQRTQEVTLARMFRFSIGQHMSENSGIKQSIAQRGENDLQQMVDLLLFQTVPLVAEVILLTGILFYWSLSIGTVVVLCIGIYLACVRYLNDAFRPEIKQFQKAFNKDDNLKREIISNIGMIIAQGQEDKAMGERSESLRKASEYAQGVWSRFITFAVMRDVIPIFGIAAVLLIGIYGVHAKSYTVGQLTMFLSWTAGALGSLGEMSPIHRRLISQFSTVKRYFDMLEIEPDVKEIANPVRPEKFYGRIEFKDLTFRYTRRDAPGYLDDQEDEEEKKKDDEVVEVGPALDGVNLVIEAGQTVAFVGESGAGKSTLIHALTRAQDPEKGQIIVDDNDLRLLDLKHYRHSIGIVDQNVALFDQTLRYNITYGLNGKESQVGDHELKEVVRMSCIDRFWPRLENGFDTVIGERGVKLSGGERQRVGIARALVKNPDILIFDEATSNLDSENESLIQESIEKAAKGRTTIIIAHRFSTIRKVDKIFVFDKGKLVGQGTHNELAHDCEPYQRLLKNQKI